MVFYLQASYEVFAAGKSAKERKFWKQYMQAYEACLSATSTKDAPWYVVPADDKENVWLIVSRIIIDTFKELKMHHPETDAKRQQELLSIRQGLVEEGQGGNKSR